jgi:hypothetical protein
MGKPIVGITEWLTGCFSSNWLLSRGANRLFATSLLLSLTLTILVVGSGFRPDIHLRDSLPVALLVMGFGVVTAIGMIFLHFAMLACIILIEKEPVKFRRWSFVVECIPIVGAAAYYVFRYRPTLRSGAPIKP